MSSAIAIDGKRHAKMATAQPVSFMTKTLILLKFAACKATVSRSGTGARTLPHHAILTVQYPSRSGNAVEWRH
jgi:hypothetical protein